MPTRTKAIIYLLIVLMPAGSLLYAFKFDYTRRTEESEVKIWRQSLEQKKSWALVNAAGFEENLLWEDKSKLSFASRFERSASLPGDEAYKLELEMLEKFTPSPVSKNVLSLRTHFNLPGREVYAAGPRVPVELKGYIKRFSVWVHSAGYRHSLWLDMEDTFKRKKQVKIASLDFKGWRRFDVTLPPAFSVRNQRSNEPYKNTWHGIVIKSSRFSKRHFCHIMLDNFNFLVDRSEWEYPGAKIKDNWGDFIGKKRIR